MSDDYANEGYDEWLDAISEGRGYYLECPEGHGELPPRRICPTCGSTDLREEPLPDVGEIETYTVTSVAAPSFADDAPYVVAVVDFGPVTVTGQVKGVDPDAVEVGMTVGIDVDRRVTTDEPLVVFRPR